MRVRSLAAALLAGGFPAVAAAQAPDSVRSATGWRPPVGASSTRIDLDSVELAGITTLTELLQARVPGLLVRSLSGAVGAGAELLARGRKSVSAFPEPLLVMDGVQAVGTSRSFALDVGQSVSRLDDIPLEQIQSVEVLTGVAAAARFGPAATTGAVLVTTRMGPHAASGAVRWTRGVFVDAGGSPKPESRLLGVIRVDSAALANGSGALCPIVDGARPCLRYGLVPFDPLVDAPFQAGRQARAGLRVGRGSLRTNWLLTGDVRSASGVLGGNATDGASASARVDVRPTSKLSVAVRASASRRDVALRANDLATAVRPLSGVAVPARIADPIEQRASRADATVDAGWYAAPGLRVRATLGTSQVDRREADLSSPATVATTYRQIGSGHDRVSTARLALIAERRFGPALTATSVGVEGVDTRARDSAVVLQRTPPSPPFTDLVAGRSIDRRSRQRAAIASERLTWNRVDADLSVRYEAGSPFRVRDRNLLGGTASIAVRAFDSRAVHLSVRAGASDVPTAVDVPYLDRSFVLPGSPQPPAATPRTREGELGIDAEATRFSASVRAYRQRSDDRSLADGLGLFGQPIVTLPRVDNRGLEARVRVRVVDQPSLGVMLGAQAWGNRNRLLRLSGVRTIVSPTALTSRLVDGEPRPITSYWASTRTSFRDANGDGFVGRGEVTVDRSEDAYRFAGQTDAARAVAGDVELRVGRRTTIRALAEYRGGVIGVGARPTEQLGNARTLYDVSTPLDAQIRYVARPDTDALPLQDASFTRLREASASFALPWRLMPGLTLTLAGRNLLTFTGYSGTDPEAFLGGDNTIYAQPIPPSVNVRLSARW